ncbi:hypothetical protein AtDm6_0043 [Acetobacter tropicalis]|uniref:Uncharacterized protein n=1 Tax=Acetobacter tropicalis TaxID=104102 RepID=A0A094Z171_9PROT|nr:hypothetical protein AtDm6_0043 [Acetobacter tropicalis]
MVVEKGILHGFETPQAHGRGGKLSSRSHHRKPVGLCKIGQTLSISAT